MNEAQREKLLFITLGVRALGGEGKNKEGLWGESAAGGCQAGRPEIF